MEIAATMIGAALTITTIMIVSILPSRIIINEGGELVTGHFWISSPVFGASAKLARKWPDPAGIGRDFHQKDRQAMSQAAVTVWQPQILFYKIIQKIGIQKNRTFRRKNN